MSKKSLTAAALFSAAVLGGAFFAANGASNVNAATAGGDAVGFKGNAYISFTNDKPTGPIDHESGSDSGNPSDSTNDTGDLTLDAIPKVLNFGDHKAGEADEYKLIAHNDGEDAEGKYDEANGQALAKNGNRAASQPRTTGTEDWIFTQVTNLSAKNPTWKLNVALDKFTNLDSGADATADALPGATITFANEKSQLLGDGDVWQPLSDEMDQASDFTLTAGDKDGKTYITGSTTTGTTQQAWQAKDVTFKLAKNKQLQGDYSAEMTWTLSSSVATTTDSGAGTGESAPAGNE